MPNPPFDPIEYLTDRKFPDRKLLRHLGFPYQGKLPIPHDYVKRRNLEIESFQAELRAKSPEELNLLVQEEQGRRYIDLLAAAERAEQQMFCNQPNARADFEHWSKISYWTLEEGVALSFGRAPEVVSWGKLKDYVDRSSFAKSFSKVRELALRAAACNLLTDPVAPGVFLAWAARSDIAVPPDLIRQVETRGIVIADWKTVHDNLKKQFDVLLADRDRIAEICKRLIQDRDEWKSKAINFESLTWEGFDDESETYPRELDIAMQAWRAATNARDSNLTAKERIEGWLDSHYPDRRTLSNEARHRIAVVCNWEKTGGRPRSE